MMLPIESDADAAVSAMCQCGRVWLTSGIVRFDAEGAEHGRSWCRRIPQTGAPVTSPSLDG